MAIDKRQRFLKVAVNRTNRIITDIRLLGNCANKNNYEYTDEEIKQIFAAVEEETKNAKAKFLPGTARRKQFSFKENK